VVLAVLCLTRRRKRLVGFVLFLWLLYTGFFVQEWRALFRWKSLPSAEWETAHKNGSALRVISLNCNGGNERAATEVADYHPDLVFFEESPLRPVVRGMATKILGPQAESLCGSDVSIVARGKLTPVPVENSESAPFAHARIQFASGLTAEVFAVRLQPYNIRADLWSPECWRNQCRIRKLQRSQFEWLEREVEKVPHDVPIILGGDFNLPAGDNLFRLLQSRLRDTFRQSGHGWGDTLDNDWPVLRIDQIWCNGRFRSVSVSARRTANSDHRMIICDLLRIPVAGM
jgi:endonuclease/exonuclease/phosphatase (EEP) superfamily protein YafD